MSRSSVVAGWIVIAVTAAAGAACGGSTPGEGSARSETAAAADWFVNRAQEAGLRFVHFNGMSGQYYIPENMGPGAALLDYDNDGDLDVYLVQGQPLGSGRSVSPPDPASLRGRLFRNELQTDASGKRAVRFTDVTGGSGIDARTYGMGVATGDFDNNGCVDLYLTNFGPNQLWKNNCDGTFSDVSRQSGTEAPGWSVSAAFLDYDRDGLLDLFVGRYLDYTVARDVNCVSPSGEEDYCNPSAYSPQPSRLFRNTGNGRFSDVTAAALVSGEFGPALGVTTADFNGDGWIDIYVANDSKENQLWINQRDGTFRNTALLAGAALTIDGRAEASMGIDAGDFDNDGDEDLVMTELTSQGHNLFVNDGTGTFDDISAPSGLGPGSLPFTGFGAAWIDVDNDGMLDVLTVNGTIIAIEAQKRTKEPLPQKQPKQLFRNLGGGRFEEASARGGAALASAQVGRGAAFGDVDNDGDTDVIVANDSGQTELLVNEIGSRRHWLGLRLIGSAQNRDMLGSRVAVIRPGAPTLWRRARSDGSYASANDPRVLAGLGDSTQAPRVRVQWPGGRVEEWADVPIDRYTTLKEGTGKPVAGAG